MRGSSASLPSRAAAASSASMSLTPSAITTPAPRSSVPCRGSGFMEDEHARFVLGQQLCADRHVTGLHKLADIRRHALADPGNRQQLFWICRQFAASCVVCCSTASAARRYERIRNGSAASISRSAAVSSSSRAISMFSISASHAGPALIIDQWDPRPIMLRRLATARGMRHAESPTLRGPARRMGSRRRALQRPVSHAAG